MLRTSFSIENGSATGVVYLVCCDQSVVQARTEGYKFEAVAVEMSATKELKAGARDNSQGNVSPAAFIKSLFPNIKSR